MKQIFILILLCFSIVGASAQKKYETEAKSSRETRKGYVGLSIGAAIPLGKFAGTDIPQGGGATTDDLGRSGYATGSVSAYLMQFQYQFHDMLAFNASWFGLSNGVDLDALTRDIFTGPGAAGIVRTLDKPSSMGGVLVGLSLKKQTFPLFARASVGYAGVKNAEITFKQQGSVTIKQSDMVIGLGYEFGAGAIFQLGNHFGLLLEATYLGTNAKSKDVQIVGGGIVLDNIDFDYSQQVFIIKGGLGYMF